MRYTFAHFSLDIGRRELAGPDGFVPLRPKVFDLVAHLITHRDRVVTAGELRDRLWPGLHVSDATLTGCVKEARRAVGDDGRSQSVIRTLHGHGYRFVADVEECWPAEGVPPGGHYGGAADFALSSYAAYLDACALFDKGGRRNLQAAVEIFSRLIDTDARFAPAYAGLAKSLTFIDLYCGRSDDGLIAALDNCKTSLRVDPRSAEAYAAQGLALSAMGAFDAAWASFREAIRLRPDGHEVHYFLGRACFARGDFARAVTLFERAANLRADDFHALLLGAKARRKLGDRHGAQADLMKATLRIDLHLHADPDDVRALCDKAACLAELGRKDDALALVQRVGAHRDPMAFYLACVLARAGETPAAIDCLEEVLDAGWSHASWLSHEPDFDGLRDERRFARLESALAAA